MSDTKATGPWFWLFKKKKISKMKWNKTSVLCVSMLWVMKTPHFDCVSTRCQWFSSLIIWISCAEHRLNPSPRPPVNTPNLKAQGENEKGSSFIVAYQTVLKRVRGTCPVLAVCCRKTRQEFSWLARASSALLTDLAVAMTEQYKWRGLCSISPNIPS